MITEEDAEVIAGYLRDESEAVAEIDGWIRRAAAPYRRRLSHQWDDLLQDLRMEVTRLLGNDSFRGRSSLRTYLWRVVSHSCLDRIRHHQRWQWTDLEEAESAGAPLSRGTERLPAWSSSRDLLLRVLERMPSDCRRMWNMIVAGLSYREMSRQVGVSSGALRVRVLRCRQRASQARRELEIGNETASPGA